jgi:trans-aconitate 2-methyltransferase
MPHEFDGQEYKKASVVQKQWGNNIISEFKLNGSERILDLGCGDGVLTAQLAALVPKGSVLGIDSSQGMLQEALKLQTPTLKFELQDINNLDFEEAFDLIFSNATLHWLANHQALLNHVYRGLKKGGLARFNFASDGNCSTFINIVRETMEIPQFRRYFYNFQWPWYMPGITEYQALVKQLPFKEVRIWIEQADYYFPDADSFTRWLDQPSLVPFKAVLQPPDRGFFRDWVVQQNLDVCRQPDGTYFMPFRRLNVELTK